MIQDKAPCDGLFLMSNHFLYQMIIKVFRLILDFLNRHGLEWFHEGDEPYYKYG